MDNSTGGDKPYDLTMINEMCDNNRQFLEKLLVVFADNLAADMHTLKQAAYTGNWDEVAQMAHKMKSSLLHFGVNSLKDTISRLEHYNNSDTQTLHSQVTQFELVVNSVLLHLRQEFPDVLT